MISGRIGRAFVLSCLGIWFILETSSSAAVVWRRLATGCDLTQLSSNSANFIANPDLTIVRLDPAHWQLALVGRKLTGETSNYTPKVWCQRHELALAINAGMFNVDRVTHVGYLRDRLKVNNKNLNSYKSIAAFNPKRRNLPAFKIFDLDASGVSLKSILRDYESAMQNLRLIKRAGRNVWKPQAKRWSETALGEDSSGRILFIFCATPYSMFDLNKILLNLKIGLVCAQHLEGGPEAQLYLKLGSEELQLSGGIDIPSFGVTTLNQQLELPFVLGARPKVKSKTDR